MNMPSLKIVITSVICVFMVGMVSPNKSCLAQTQSKGLLQLTDMTSTQDRNAILRESKVAIDLKTKYIRGIIGDFEQGSGVEGGIQFTTADKIPFIELRATAIVSTKFYRGFEIEAYVPKIGDEKMHADIWFGYLTRTKDNFFGFGPNTPDVRTNFMIEQRSFNALLYRDITHHLQAGLYGQLANSSTFRGRRTSDKPIDQIYSGDPNVIPVSLWAPGLGMNTKILSYGGYALYDRRNNEQGLTRGAYLYGRAGSSDGFKNHVVFSDYGWMDIELDGRGYVPLGSHKTTFALRGYYSMKDPKGNSQIPFYELAFLGGNKYVRGFQTYRFRANRLLLYSAELRQTIYTQKKDRGLDIVAFGDTGKVWGDNRSLTDPTILNNQAFNSGKWKTGFGGGLEYRLSKKVAARIEIARSKEGTQYYLSLSRGF